VSLCFIPPFSPLCNLYAVLPSVGSCRTIATRRGHQHSVYVSTFASFAVTGNASEANRSGMAGGGAPVPAVPHPLRVRRLPRIIYATILLPRMWHHPGRLESGRTAESLLVQRLHTRGGVKCPLLRTKKRYSFANSCVPQGCLLVGAHTRGATTTPLSGSFAYDKSRRLNHALWACGCPGQRFV